MFMLPKFHFNVENWKWNKEYRIYVSSFGNIKNERKESLPKKIDHKGYFAVYVPYTHKFIKVHRLVLKTFKPIADMENLTVDHLDSNKRNNKLDNLEWVTEFENKERAKKNQLCKKDVLKQENVYEKINVIVSGNLVFNNFNEAAEFLLQDKGNCGTLPQTQRKIYNAIVSNKKYCGRKWRVEKRNG